MTSPLSRNMAVLYSITLLVSAFLLFCIEPLVAKMLLPLLGGVPAVWNTCLVFFQAVLLLGYLLALATFRLLGARRQAVVQLVVVAAPLLTLPFVIDEHLADRFAGLGPVGQVFAVLTVAAGPPFLALSTMAPTLQRWFAASGAKGAKDPYFLYAASNLGSLAALAAYPLVIEPRLGLRPQGSSLRWAYLALVVLTALCAVGLWRGPAQGEATTSAATTTTTSWPRRARWVFLSAVPSAYLVAVTTHLTTDVAPVPLLWTLPLAAYLATFVLVFASRTLIPHGIVVRLAPLVAMPAIYLTCASISEPVFAIAIHLVCFFWASMLCHGELARDRPEPERLNEFYVWVSVGGFLGGVACALVVPTLTSREIEYPACIVLALVARPRVTSPDGMSTPRFAVVAPVIAFAVAALIALGLPRIAPSIASTTPALVAPLLPVLAFYPLAKYPRPFAAIVAAAMLGTAFLPSPFGTVLLRERNFFGTLNVVRDDNAAEMQEVHGNTVHGVQSIESSRRAEPTAYFTTAGPVGDVFRVFRERDLPRRFAVAGLGVGTIAAYAQPGDGWTFFEINPIVIRLAENASYFTFLADARARGATVDVVLGDARLEVDRRDGGYGMVVEDTFNSDAVPVHLLTREAMAIYVHKLVRGGMIVWNISNRMIDLRPVLHDLAEHAGWRGRVRVDTTLSEAERAGGRKGCIWVVMMEHETDLAALGESWVPLAPDEDVLPWTDDHSSVYTVLRF